MLQIHEICKEYKTGDLVQTALDHVSLNLRDNEFVAILGPSGSGKTTLLNIIGGLDRYDSGDLIINDISTKEYTDRDWDSYRNHTIGFVFQSYNLIPHQTVLSNVELALTISGIDKAERRKRAMEALEKVGLADQAHKKPNQMSGGQMQRVAIARALVNDPDILLADEPTGALDTNTSVMVMDLLKEVAKDRLVVMVTHNPELAEEYATRIVNLKDGKILSDSDPVTDVMPPVPTEGKKQTMGKASMNFMTALSLSFQNLWTKKARTLLTAFAGSIGIIGIAAILSLSTGVNDYIQNVEEETLSEYPLEITKSGVSLSNMQDSASSMLKQSDEEEEEDKEDEKKGEIPVSNALAAMFSSTTTNDLAALKTYLESGESDIDEYAKAIEYSYNITPIIYQDNDDSIRQVNPDQTFAALGFGSSSSSASLFSTMFSTDVFHEMPATESLYEDQYDVLAGTWPQNYNECVLVLGQRGTVNDFFLYEMGLLDASELDQAILNYTKDDTARLPEHADTVSYDDILNVTFKLVINSDLYSYDSEYDMWIDKSDDASYVKNLVQNGETLKIVGIVQPSANANGAALTTGINYPASLTEYITEKAASSEIVKSQLENEDINVFTGEPFGTDSNKDVDLSSMFSIDNDALSDLFSFDLSSLSSSMDFSSALSNMSLDLDFDSLLDSDLLSSIDLSIDSDTLQTLNQQLVKNLANSVSEAEMENIFLKLVEGYEEYAKGNSALDYFNIGTYITEYLESEQAQKILQDTLQSYLDSTQSVSVSVQELSSLMLQLMSGFQGYCAQMGYTDIENITTYMQEYLSTASAQQLMQQWISTNVQLQTDTSALASLASSLASTLAAGYSEYAQANNFPQPEKMAQDFLTYLSSDTAKNIIENALDSTQFQESIQAAVLEYASGLGSAFGQQLEDQISSQISSMVTSLSSQLSSSIASAMASAFSGLSLDMDSLMNIDAEDFSDIFSFNMDVDDLSSLAAAMSVSSSPSLESNLETLGYADFSDPYEIMIYPYNFESKAEITEILNDYNEKMEAEGMSDRVISYTDIVGTLMTSVTEIVGLISNVLIAFVSISLIVSSIMIGVITYISVLERQKEIGILRAMGASKHNISQVFNAETMIIGFAAGIIGIGLTLLLLIPGNMLIHALSDTSMQAALPIGGALLLIVLSVILTVIGGLIPASKAAKSNPVTALRTE